MKLFLIKWNNSFSSIKDVYKACDVTNKDNGN